ncbi:hypothetical protein ACVB8X_22855 [Streptomyces sp. NRAIS4]
MTTGDASRAIPPLQVLVLGMGKPTWRERHHGHLLQPKRVAAQHFAPPDGRRGEVNRYLRELPVTW